jgi:RNA polymerase sigma-70 factor (ECF subfamily)
MTLLDNNTLAFAAGRGDRVAAAQLVRATQAHVWRYVACLADRRVADDLTQETYLRAFRALRTFRGDVDLRVWLLAIARRTVADHHRRQRRRPISVPSAPDIEPVIPDHANTVALQQLIRHLDADRRTAFVLSQLLGLSYADAAAVCDVPVGTIRSRVARARDDLIRALESAPTTHTPEHRRRRQA